MKRRMCVRMRVRELYICVFTLTNFPMQKNVRFCWFDDVLQHIWYNFICQRNNKTMHATRSQESLVATKRESMIEIPRRDLRFIGSHHRTWINDISESQIECHWVRESCCGRFGDGAHQFRMLTHVKPWIVDATIDAVVNYWLIIFWTEKNWRIFSTGQTFLFVGFYQVTILICSHWFGCDTLWTDFSPMNNWNCQKLGEKKQYIFHADLTFRKLYGIEIWLCIQSQLKF